MIVNPYAPLKLHHPVEQPDVVVQVQDICQEEERRYKYLKRYVQDETIKIPQVCFVCMDIISNFN